MDRFGSSPKDWSRSVGRLVKCGLIRSSMSQAQNDAISGLSRDVRMMRSMPEKTAVETPMSRLARRYEGTLEAMDDGLFTANLSAIRRSMIAGVRSGSSGAPGNVVVLGAYGDEWWISGGRLKIRPIPGYIRLSGYDSLHGAVIRTGMLDIDSMELSMYCLFASEVVDDGTVVSKDPDDVGTVE